MCRSKTYFASLAASARRLANLSPKLKLFVLGMRRREKLVRAQRA